MEKNLLDIARRAAHEYVECLANETKRHARNNLEAYFEESELDILMDLRHQDPVRFEEQLSAAVNERVRTAVDSLANVLEVESKDLFVGD